MGGPVRHTTPPCLKDKLFLIRNLTMTHDEFLREYEKYAHRQQSALAFLQGGVEEGLIPPEHTKSMTGKHLRVGVNNALAEIGALGGLLIKKGIITEQEYFKAMLEGVEREADRCEEEARAIAGFRSRISFR